MSIDDGMHMVLVGWPIEDKDSLVSLFFGSPENKVFHIYESQSDDGISAV